MGKYGVPLLYPVVSCTMYLALVEGGRQYRVATAIALIAVLEVEEGVGFTAVHLTKVLSRNAAPQ